MVLLSLTASHREMDLDALERLSSGSASVGRTVVGSCSPVQGAVVISTCNRFEVYVDVEAPLTGPAVHHATEHVAALVASASGIPDDEAAGSFTVRTASEAVSHLFEVASGLDSMVIGEREIAGQVKRALELAREQQTTSKTLELLFQTASRTSKLVGTSTSLGSAGRSIVRLGLDVVAAELPEWRDVRTVLIGTGSYAGATLASLRQHGVRDIRVWSQSGRAEQFAAGHDDVVALATGEEALIDALATADLVVAVSGARSRGASHWALDSGAVAAALTSRLDPATPLRSAQDDERGLVILDLALHHDVDPSVRALDGVVLYDLQALKEHVPATARGVLDHARSIVDEAVQQFLDHQVGRAADAAVVALLDEAEQRVRSEVDAALARLRAELEARGEPADLDEDDVDKVTRDVRRRVHAALHGQITAVRAEAVAKARAAEQALVEDAESATAESAAGAAAPLDA